ncbi:MAG: LemA family protein [Chitinophagaceae bacterium]|nr:LemA family protein [Chitinophagaceae bacterium]MDB5221561.1 LemA family protein [Chitinophagaceae bacterium]
MKSRTGLYVILGLVVLLFFWGCGAYNGLVGVDQQVKAKWGDVETNYQRRTDLYNSVIKTISASANFEKSVLTDVVAARAKATSINVDINDPKSLEAYQQAQAGLQSSFSKLLAVVENYPDIKTTKAFQDFQAQIEGTENRINVARKDYNAAVQSYNLKVKTFPNNIFAGLFGYHEKPFYKSDPGSEKVPDVNFDIK